MTKIYKKYLLCTSCILWPLFSFYLIVFLNNIWFDYLDMIKYDKTYSPEFSQNKFWENLVYYSVIIVSLMIEILLI
jgi:hypothetical protein